MKDRRVIDESVGIWLLRMFFLIILMFLFGWGFDYLMVKHGIGYALGIATAIIVSEQWRLNGVFKELQEDIKDIDDIK